MGLIKSIVKKLSTFFVVWVLFDNSKEQLEIALRQAQCRPWKRQVVWVGGRRPGARIFAEGKKQGRATRLGGLEQEELERLIVKHLKEHGPTAPGVFIGPHGLDLNRKQLSGLLTNLRKNGIVIRQGNPPRWVKYSITPSSIDQETKG